MGERRWQTNLENGVVTVAVPHPMTSTDVADLKEWFALMIRVLERTNLGTGPESAPGLGQCTTPSPAREQSDGTKMPNALGVTTIEPSKHTEGI